MSAVTENGTTIHYDLAGPEDGRPVLLLHGHPFNRSMWSPQLEVLAAAGFRVIAPDLRGYGESTAAGVSGAQDVTLLSDFARDAVAVLDHLGVERAVVGGLSMGGQIVMEFHRGHPERVSALVLADTSPEAETDEGKASRNAMADRLLAEGMGGYAEEVLDKMVAPYNVTGMPEVARQVLGMMCTTSPEGAAAALRGRAERPDYRATLAEADVPVLIVVGEDDAYTPVDGARRMHEEIPGSALVVIEGAAHMPNLERTEEFNAALLRFLGTREGGRP